MAMVMTVLRKPRILRYTARNGEHPGVFEETIVLPQDPVQRFAAGCSIKCMWMSGHDRA